MSTTEPKLPGPDHPIEITPSSQRVVVRVGGRIVADSSDALLLREAGHDPVVYLPLSDLDASVLHDSETTTWCPYKGTASYYSIDAGGELVTDAVWYYPEAFEAVAEIGGHAAFYTDRVSLELS